MSTRQLLTLKEPQHVTQARIDRKKRTDNGRVVYTKIGNHRRPKRKRRFAYVGRAFTELCIMRVKIADKKWNYVLGDYQGSSVTICDSPFIAATHAFYDDVFGIVAIVKVRVKQAGHIVIRKLALRFDIAKGTFVRIGNRISAQKILHRYSNITFDLAGV